MNHHIFVVGANEHGELCSGDDVPIKSLTSLNSLNQNIKINNINSGDGHTIITTQNNQYLGVGYNEYGECGVGKFDSPLLKPIEMNYVKQNNIKIKQIVPFNIYKIKYSQYN